MAYAIPFDTLAYAKELENAGIPSIHAEAQAKALAGVIQKAGDAIFEELADKRDLKVLEGQLSTKADVAKVDIHVLELKRDIELVKAELKRDMTDTKAEIVKWLVTLAIAQMGLMTGILVAVLRIAAH